MDGSTTVLVGADDFQVRNEFDTLMVAVKSMMNIALSKYGDFASGHEIYGVVAEELDEFFDDVRADRLDDSELIDIAVAALRAAAQIRVERRNAIQL